MPNAAQTIERFELGKTGIALSNLDVTRFQKIMEIWDQVVGGSGKRFLCRDDLHAERTLQDIKDTLLRSGNDNRRIGSKLDRNSKLWITIEKPSNPRISERVILFTFEANLDPKDRDRKASDVQTIEIAFNQALMEYLVLEKAAVACK